MGECVDISEDQNVLYLDRYAPTTLVWAARDHYMVQRGRLRLGDIVFHKVDPWLFGWRYFPRSNRLQPSRKLHPDPMAAIRGRVRVDVLMYQGMVSLLRAPRPG